MKVENAGSAFKVGLPKDGGVVSQKWGLVGKEKKRGGGGVEDKKEESVESRGPFIYR
jgi:hypothetical protein